jgi:hypothetical protein
MLHLGVFFQPTAFDKRRQRVRFARVFRPEREV